MNILAVVYHSQGNYGQAEPLYKQALATLEQTLGLDHSNTAEVIHNLIMFYKKLGRTDEADAIKRKGEALNASKCHTNPDPLALQKARRPSKKMKQRSNEVMREDTPAVRALSKEEIESLIARGRKLSDKEGIALMNQFEREQPDLYRFICGEPREAIAEDNADMANLYPDLCMDILYVYREAFGKPLKTKRGDRWVDDALVLIDAEFQAMLDDCPMEAPLRKRLQDRFVHRTLEGGIQMELLRYVQNKVTYYASLKEERRSAIDGTNNYLVAFLRLMDELYSRKKK